MTNASYGKYVLKTSLSVEKFEVRIARSLSYRTCADVGIVFKNDNYLILVHFEEGFLFW